MAKKVFKPLFDAIEFEIDGQDYSIAKVTNDQGQDFIRLMNTELDKDADPSGMEKSICMLSILMPDVPKEKIRKWDMTATIDLVKYVTGIITKAMTGTVEVKEKNASSPELPPSEA